MKKAFTLAEVLITLVIVGVVAALTIPTLMNKIEDAHFKTQYKKAFAELAQALTMSNNDGCYEATLVGNTATQSACIYLKLKIDKFCTGADKCWTQDNVKALNGTVLTTSPWPGYKTASVAVLADGSTIVNYNSPPTLVSPPNYVLKIYVMDLNGLKKPNTLGRDIHFFTIEVNSSMPPVLKPHTSFNRYPAHSSEYDEDMITQGCLGLNVSGSYNLGYTCGSKWLRNDN